MEYGAKAKAPKGESPTAYTFPALKSGTIERANVAGIDYRAKKLFLTVSGKYGGLVVPMSFKPNVKVIDAFGKKKSILDVDSGTWGTVQYKVGPEGVPHPDKLFLDSLELHH